ncbi:MAG: PorV/PorQ family protein [candidate division WOR-3 bacterium]
MALFFCCFSFAAENGYFLTYPPSGRIIGLGGCFTAIADDPYTTFYNDAGLGAQNKIGFGYSYGTYIPSYIFPDMKHRSDFWVFSAPLPLIGGGIGITTITENLTAPEYVFPEDGRSLKLSLGRNVFKELSLGVGIKLISIFLSTGYDGPPNFLAFDFSSLYEIHRYRIGFAIANIGKPMEYFSGDTFLKRVPLPSLFRAGVSRELTIGGNRLTAAVDLTRSFCGYLKGDDGILRGFDIFWNSAGIEYSIKNVLLLRLGYLWDINGLSTRTGFSTGIGVKLLDDLLSIDFGIAHRSVFNVSDARLSILLEVPPKLFISPSR